jgi:hypothetical protein
VSAIVAGTTFIVVVLCLALLLLVVDPKDLEKEHDKGVLLPEEPDDEKQ